VLAQGFEQFLAEHDIAIFPAFAALHVDHVARTVDVRNLQTSQLGPTESCGIKRHQQSALERRGAASIRLFTSSRLRMDGRCTTFFG
jgi:hypothetical protein